MQYGVCLKPDADPSLLWVWSTLWDPVVSLHVEDQRITMACAWIDRLHKNPPTLLRESLLIPSNSPHCTSSSNKTTHILVARCTRQHNCLLALPTVFTTGGACSFYFASTQNIIKWKNFHYGTIKYNCATQLVQTTAVRHKILWMVTR